MGALKDAGMYAAGVAAMIVVAVIIVAIISGIAFVANVISPLVVRAAWIAFAVCLIVLLPLSFFKAGRKFSFYGFYYSSFVFGTCAWVLGFLETDRLWGTFGLLVGLFLGVIGVIPVAIVASIFHGLWNDVLALVALVVLCQGTRYLATYLAIKIDNDAIRAGFVESGSGRWT
jgi:hypothetical protein